MLAAAVYSISNFPARQVKNWVTTNGEIMQHWVRCQRIFRMRSVNQSIIRVVQFVDTNRPIYALSPEEGIATA